MYGIPSGWPLISVLFHQSVVSYQCGLSSGLSFIRVVSSGWSFVRLVFHQVGLSSGWPFIRVVSHPGRVVFHQGGLSLVKMVFRQGGLLAGYSLSSGWSFIRMVSHQGGFSSVRGVSSGWSFSRVFFFIRDSTNTTNIVDWTSHLKWQFNISSSFSSFNLWMLHWFSGQLALMWWSTYMTSCETPVKDCARDQLGAALPGWCWLVLCLGFERVWKFRKQQCKD